MPDIAREERILVVDDDPQIRRLLVGLLGAQGFSCVAARDVEEARTQFRELDAALVLLDVHLPGETGLAFARELAAGATNAGVVMISGQDDLDVAQIALDAGAYGYVTKPFKPNEVPIAVSYALRRRRRDLEHRTHRAKLEDRVLERTVAAQDAFAQLRLANEETVLRLSKAVEYRDPETGAHIERMSHLCAMLGGRFGLDADLTRVASRLHDVGKIAIADSILLKPGPLTPAERADMQCHADIGYRLLSGSRSELLDHAAVIAWTHHERFDGSGYPRGLAGEQIPLAGRIAGVADVFDALITNRVYRSAMSFEEAIGLLAAERGRHFDPAVLDTFIEYPNDIKAIVARFDEARTEHDEPPEGSRGRQLMTLPEAAAALGLTPTQLRRRADTGTIASVYTAGGHRTFTAQAVHELAAQLRATTRIRPVQPPNGPLPTLADTLRVHGSEAVVHAAAWLYPSGPRGWLGSEAAAAPTREWIDAFTDACASGNYTPLLDATDVLMRRAYLQSASLLERHRFLERFADLALQTLSHSTVPHGELVAARRLFAAVRETLLDRPS